MSAVHREPDEKAARMLEIFAEQRFATQRAAQRMRLRLVVWVIRTKLQDSLKRMLDVALGSVALLLLSPLMLLTALAVRLSSPGPILFRQQRIGMWGEPFTCFKFRSMVAGAEMRKAELLGLNEADGPIFKMKDDPRITPLGRFIRKTSIDELPQLFNVLRGEMSLVGPRPAVPAEVDSYEYAHLARLGAIPGITGLQQVSGRSDIEFSRWVELDVQYIAEQSLWTDIKILLRTIPTVLFSHGAY